jgi:protein TonB
VQAEAAVEKTVEPTKEPELERTPDAELVVASTPPKPDPTESDNTPPAPVTSAPQAQQLAIAPVPAAPNQGVMKPSQATSVPRWSSRIAAALERNKRYPADASRRRQHGVARVAFSIDRKGYVLASRIVHGSGSAALDEETLALLQRAQPFPPPPPELAGDRIDLVVPVRFDLR